MLRASLLFTETLRLVYLLLVMLGRVENDRSRFFSTAASVIEDELPRSRVGARLLEPRLEVIISLKLLLLLLVL